MDTTRKARIAVIVVAAVSLAGCTAGEPDAATPTPVEMTALPSASPTSTADADIEREKAALPIPAEGISDWANTAVPAPEPGEGAGTLSGWMSQSTSPNMLTSFTTLPPGDYQAQIACRGEGTITVTAGEIDAAPAAGPLECDNSTVAFGVQTAQTGLELSLALEGAPTIYAVSVVPVG